jgi:hypothetical protein
MPHSPHDDFTALIEAYQRTGAQPSPPRSRHAPVLPPLDLLMETQQQPVSSLPPDAAAGFAALYAAEAAAAPIPSPHISAPCDPQTIAAELDLSPDLTIRDLERIRRTFALANHPDRLGSAQHGLATQRMTIANMLIDEALRDRRRRETPTP